MQLWVRTAHNYSLRLTAILPKTWLAACMSFGSTEMYIIISINNERPTELFRITLSVAQSSSVFFLLASVLTEIMTIFRAMTWVSWRSPPHRHKVWFVGGLTTKPPTPPPSPLRPPTAASVGDWNERYIRTLPPEALKTKISPALLCTRSYKDFDVPASLLLPTFLHTLTSNICQYADFVQSSVSFAGAV